MIRVVTKLDVSPGKEGPLREFITHATAAVREHEAGKTLAYEFYSAEQGALECLVFESFVDAEALMQHMSNIAERTATAGDSISVKSVDICGRLTADVVQTLKAQGGATMTFFGNLLSTL